MAAKILDLQKVTVSFDGFKVLDGLDFSLDYGELRFLIGPNGAGKTTLLDIITGKTRPDYGMAVFDQRVDLRKQTEHKIVRLGIGRKFQTPSVFGSLTVYQNLEAALGFRDSTARLFRPLTGEKVEKLNLILRQINLEAKAQKPAGTLSHGEKQWLEIGILLVQEPKLVLLDEPVAGMTRRERDKTGALLQAIGQERSILVVEHDMQFVRQFASKVTVLHQGRLLCEGPVDEVQSDPRVIEVYIGKKRDRAA